MRRFGAYSMIESLTRWAYTVAGLLVLPGLIWHLLWRGLRQREYWKHWQERFLGAAPQALANWHTNSTDKEHLLWIHAVSVGETRAAEPLIRRWLDQSAGHRIILTHTTPTGRMTGATCFSDVLSAQPLRLLQCYLPYDLPWANDRFLRWAQPGIGALMETELWPNLLAAARDRKIPIALINARLSPRSGRRLLALRWLSWPAVAGLAGIAAQTERDAEGLRSLLALAPLEQPVARLPKIAVLGNMKFDLSVSAAFLEQGRLWREAFNQNPRSGISSSSRIWAAVSTRDDEEEKILQAWSSAKAHQQLTENDHLLIVPRHPQRFERVVQIITAQGMRACRRSAQWQLPLGDSQPQSGVTTVLLGDSLGEMFAYLQMSDLVLIGGSLLPLGGQNPLEACALGRPVFFGPHMFNFHEIARALKACGAGFEIATIGDWITQGRRCLDDPHELQRRANAAIDFSIVHRGAADRYLEFLKAISPADR